MSAPTSKPYQWLRKIPSSLLKLDTVPLFGNPPEFPLDQFQTTLQQIFEDSSIQIKVSSPEWRTEEELFVKLSDPLVPLEFTVGSFEGSLYWAMAESDIALLMSLLLTKETHPLDIIDSEFQEGFYRFLGIEAINAASESGYEPSLVPKLRSEVSLPNEPMLCFDVAVYLQGHQVFGRLFVDPALKQAIAEHFGKKDPEAALKKPLSEKVEVTLHLEAGQTGISYSEWKDVSPGDVLILESCSIKPGENKGRVMMTLQGRPFFRAMVKDGNIKILENPLYHEVESE